MSFNFGGTPSNQNTFGSFFTPPKPTGFGAPISFGTPQTTAASGGFGTFSSSFGTPAAQTAPAFGTSLGTPSASAAPAFGSSFGTPATSAPAFGSTSFGGNASFGAPNVTAPPFGSTFGTPATSAPGFGTSFGTPASTAPGFGGSVFGATPAAQGGLFGASTSKPSLFGATTTPSLFSTPGTAAPLFGSTTTTQAGSLFGAATTTTPSLFGASTSTPSLFGAGFGATTSTPSLFGSTTNTSGGFNLFGNTATSSAPSLFGGFGGSTANTNTFGGFGTQNTGLNFGGGSNLFGAKPAVTVQQPQDNKTRQTLQSFYGISLFGDDRDEIIKKWNMLQACWGTGKGYFNSTQPPVDYDHSNHFYRFKAISYVVTPNVDNADGFVKLVLNKKEAELINQKSVIINGLNAILGNKPNLTVNIVHIKAISDTETELMITVSEKSVTGTNRKIHSTELAGYLNQPVQKQQLTNAGVTFIGSYVSPSKAQIEDYLKEPPLGIDQQMWIAAQADNPNPNKYLPSPITGFSNLKKRMLCEEYETGLHKAFLEKVNGDITELKKKHAGSMAHIAEQKQKFQQLQHRVLRILVKQETTRKVGLALQPEEEMLRARLEMLHTQLNLPTQFRGKINELMSSTRVKNTFDPNENENYRLDSKVQEDIKQFLAMEQNGITHLIKTINDDLMDLKIIGDGLNQLLRK